jgi:hypothetical protein
MAGVTSFSAATGQTLPTTGFPGVISQIIFKVFGPDPSSPLVKSKRGGEEHIYYRAGPCQSRGKHLF